MVSMPQALVPRAILKTIDAPGCSPGISHQPIVVSVFFSPTHYFNSMAAFWQNLPNMFFVDTRFVGHEALVDHESYLNRSVCHDLLLHVYWTLDCISIASLVSDERLRVLTPAWASWHCAISSFVGKA